MKEIKLTQGKVALVDDEDFELVSRHKWYAHKAFRNVYADTHIRPIKRQVNLLMHILIMGKKQGFEIDHINHNGLDNRRSNLRHVTHAHNIQNCRPTCNTSSIYKGVWWVKKEKKWGACIKQDGILYTLGRFITQQEAALAYNKAAFERFGEFACLNNITIEEGE